MKRFAILLFALVYFWSAGAQTYLVKSHKPIDSKKYYPHYVGVSGYSDEMYIATFRCSNGFHLHNADTYSEGSGNSYVTFSLKGAYDKVSFIFGPGRNTNDRFAAGDKGTDIVIVTADGRRVMDEVLHQWDAPKVVTLDVSGVDLLRFEDWSGLEGAYFGEVKLWKKGQTPTPYNISNASLMAKDKVKLVEELRPHLICHRGWSKPITKDDYSGISEEEYISINRIKYYSGLSMSASQELGEGISAGFAYFWLQKKFDKLSFLVGPRDNMSSNAKAWLTIKGDGKIIYEKMISQQDLAETVVIDVTGVNVISFHCGELEQSDFLKGMTFGVVDIYAYKKGCPDIPTPGVANTGLEKLSKLPDAVKLCSSHEPFSIRGTGSFDKIYFNGTSSHYHFSMGGEQFEEGFILTTGSTFMDGNINSYVAFDLAGQFDWVSFTVGTLSKRRVLGEDRIMVFADDVLILDTDVHCLWPNQKFTLPINKCRVLKFAKPGNGESKQTYLGVGDVMVFRGKPQDTDPFFNHYKPECPETVDLIDLTKGPYFHYVGRYLSSLTNFDFNDCFKNGSSIREAFTMKDGSRINKGIMLETNVPPALVFEDIDLNTAIFLFIVGAGSSISASNVAAATGISAGAGLAGALAAGYGALSLVGDKGHQSAYAAFNPFGEYESLKFTVANKAEFVDTDLFGAKLDPNNPVKLMVFADMRKVGEFTLTNKMQPATYEVPINKCTQLVFWLECGETRSGQYVFYDMTLSKKPCSAPVSDFSQSSRQGQTAGQGQKTAGKSEVTPALGNKNTAAGKGKGKGKKEAAPVDWDFDGSRSRNDAIDTYLSDIDAVWKEVEGLEKSLGSGYRVKETFVRTMAGDVYKIVEFVDNGGNRLSTTDIQKKIIEDIGSAKQIPNKVTLARIGQPSAALGLLNLPSSDAISKYGKYVKMGKEALNQCNTKSKEIAELKNMELEAVQSYIKKAINVGDKKSTAHVMILPLEPGEQPAPGTNMQMLEYYRF